MLCMSFGIYWCMSFSIYWCMSFSIYWCMSFSIYWCMSFSIYWCPHKMAINNSWLMQKLFSMHGQVQFVGNKLIYVYQLHRRCTILNLHCWHFYDQIISKYYKQRNTAATSPTSMLLLRTYIYNKLAFMSFK